MMQYRSWNYRDEELLMKVFSGSISLPGTIGSNSFPNGKDMLLVTSKAAWKILRVTDGA